MNRCLKAWRAGWFTLFVPGRVCWHKVDATSRTTEGARARRVDGWLIIATRLLPVEAAVTAWGATIAARLHDSLAGRREDARVGEYALPGSVSWLPAVVQERKDCIQPQAPPRVGAPPARACLCRKHLSAMPDRESIEGCD
jgi:hypothetical protein